MGLKDLMGGLPKGFNAGTFLSRQRVGGIAWQQSAESLYQLGERANGINKHETEAIRVNDSEPMAENFSCARLEISGHGFTFALGRASYFHPSTLLTTGNSEQGFFMSSSLLLKGDDRRSDRSVADDRIGIKDTNSAAKKTGVAEVFQQPRPLLFSPCKSAIALGEINVCLAIGHLTWCYRQSCLLK